MLYNNAQQFNYSATNIVGYNDNGYGTHIVAAGSANTKGTTTLVMSGVAITEDCYGISIVFCSGSTAAQATMFLTDIYIDPTGGSTWGSPVINNLAASSPSLIPGGGDQYYFPLFIKAGSSIGARAQSSVVNARVRLGITVYGKPKYPELIKTGTKVYTFGATTASTTGTTITPGSAGAIGSYVSLGPTSGNYFWWQVGNLINDTTQSVVNVRIDVAVGDSSNKKTVMEGVFRSGNSSEQSMKTAFGNFIPFAEVGPNQQVYVRAGCSAVPDSAHSAIVYAVEG